MTSEDLRLDEFRDTKKPWKKWGPYLSERQWGTVREDYSENGSLWDYFTHDQARSRAYRWGEDGLAGFSDDQQRLSRQLAVLIGSEKVVDGPCMEAARSSRMTKSGGIACSFTSISTETTERVSVPAIRRAGLVASLVSFICLPH